jgi:hypothetical protein
MLRQVSLLEIWTLGEHTGDSLSGRTLTFPTYRKGAGPGWSWSTRYRV